MSKVHYAILDDAEFYVKGFKRSEWEDMEEEEANELLAEIYKKQLPVDITTWVRVNTVKDTMHYKEARSEQVCFIRDVIGRIFFKKYYERPKVNVISTHMSKSVLLPVYEIKIPGLTITIENNFYSFGCSVEADMEVDCDFMGLIKEFEDDQWLYGFPDNKKFKHWANYNNKKFSFEVTSKYEFYTILFLLSQWYFR